MGLDSSVMALVSESVPLGHRILGFDTTYKIDEQHAQALSSLFAFACRYVNLTEKPHPLALDRAEVDLLARAPMGIFTVQFARTHGWNTQAGRADGAAAARNHLALGLPADSTLSCDLEGNFSSAQQAVDYAGSWYQSTLAEGIDVDATQIYIGAGVPLTSGELYQRLRFRGYWRSGSEVPDIARRGYRMIQLRPLDQVIAGVRVDLDVVQTDNLGGRPRWARLAA
jgi:hypothetical protein